MKFKTKIFITILSFLMTLSCSEESKLKEKYNCIGIDDCLSKYNFEGARAFAGLPYDIDDWREEDAHYDGWQRILDSESNYWLNEREFKKSLQILDADQRNYIPRIPGEFYAAKYNLISKIIGILLEDNEFDEARKWILKCPDKHKSGEDFSEEDSGWIKKHKPSDMMHYILNKKIDDYEKLSK